MKIKIKLHPNSSQEKIQRIVHSTNSSAVNQPKEKIKKVNDGCYEVWIKEKPIDGKANKYLEKFLKKEWGKKVKIISGLSSRMKIVEVLN